MTAQRILASQTSSLTNIRKHPATYFSDYPVAAVSKNQVAGYLVGKEFFEAMADLILQHHVQKHHPRLQTTAEILNEIVSNSIRSQGKTISCELEKPDKQPTNTSQTG